MRCFIIVATLVLAACSSGAPTTSDQTTFAARKAEMKAKLEREGNPAPEAVRCAARRARDASVETFYRVYLYERGDLTTDADREAASRDVLLRYEECGGDLAALVPEMQADDSIVHKTFTAAMVGEGR